jgi:hypothetical protein
MIWHTYAENMFAPLGIQQFGPPVFTGQKWNLAPASLEKAAKPHKKKNNNNQNPNPNPFPTQQGGGGNPNPYPTYSCDPSVVTCNPNAPGGTGGGGGNGGNGGNGNTDSVSATEAGGAVGGIFAGLPASGLWVRRRRRKRG